MNLRATQSGTNWTQSYAYDAGGRLTNTVSMAGGFLYQFQSQLMNSPSAILLPNGAYITNTFDSLARLKSTALANHWGHVLDGYTYAVDPLGLATSLSRSSQPAAGMLRPLRPMIGTTRYRPNPSPPHPEHFEDTP